MRLTWHAYRYYEYERELALREAAALTNGEVREVKGGVDIQGVTDTSKLDRLTYFATYGDENCTTKTRQCLLEESVRVGNRQATRYSVHGIHEYKGKFNPQVAKAVLNLFEVTNGSQVLDPFCGSGTTLVESAHLGATGYGIDRNPLAVFLANTKLQALRTPAKRLHEALTHLSKQLECRDRWRHPSANDSRTEYLQSWFDFDIFVEIEHTKAAIEDACGDVSGFFLFIASNLLRDYSQQDPSDLRIRRRKTPLPELPFREAFFRAAEQIIEKLQAAQAVSGCDLKAGRAALGDISKGVPASLPSQFDAAVTSPPYAMALPYIDTQRLSLVWLDLIPANQILELEADLIGSREMRGPHRRQLNARMLENSDGLPDEQADLCLHLQKAIGASDGFRRKSVPPLLYRYFSSMSRAFKAVQPMMKPGGRFGLIVGHNHTVLGGVRYDINTPYHLAQLATQAGWNVDELFPMQTYKRFGLHASNAVEAETLIVLSNPGSPGGTDTGREPASRTDTLIVSSCGC